MITTYQEANLWLDELIGRADKQAQKNVLSILSMLENPQHCAPALHVAGTNGKGSTVAYLTSALQQCGFTTAMTTSPHLCDIRERIITNQIPINQLDFTRIMEKIRILTETANIKPSWFECLTLMAFIYFAEKNPQFMIVEAGIGGRLDSTNVLNSEVVIVTEIGLDHIKVLGDTLEEIALEKIAIVKADSDVIIGCKSEKMQEFLRKEALARGARSVCCIKETDYEVIKWNHKGMQVNFHSNTLAVQGVTIPLYGHHQVRNAFCALEALVALQRRGYKIDIDRAIQGISATNWPGRFQILRSSPTLILDGAHNENAAKELLHTFHQKYGKGAHKLVFGIFSNKQVKDVVAVLAPHFSDVCLTMPPSERSLSTNELRILFEEHNCKVTLINDPLEAVATTLNNMNSKDCCLVTGSLYLVGEILQHKENFL